MAAAGQDLEKMVNKLKGRLQDATSRGCDVDAVKKVLRRLGAIPMTLELLQLTHIGKEVNGLRKVEGEVGKTAKQLVKSWKQLLASESDQRRREGRGRGEGGREGKVEGERGGEMTRVKEDTHSFGHSTSSIPTATPTLPPTAALTEFECVMDQMWDGGRSLVGGGGGGGGGGEEDASLVGGGGEEDGSLVGGGGEDGGRSPVRGGGEEGRRSPVRGGGEEGGSWSVPLAGHRKRKAVLDKSGETVAHTKRSRTLVYSGKKTTSGPQVVISLFDMSMKILIDNIDAIEEVGGVPYLILEPLLQKCTVSQLLRLEEFNPHFLEDSDVLWKKHCEKDFKGSRPLTQQSWRELYLGKLRAREERLKNITANIRKREEARKEPVRQVKMAATTRAPGRRRQASSFPLPSHPSLLNSCRSSSNFRTGGTSSVTQLKKKTMKMLKERSLMAMSRRGKR